MGKNIFKRRIFVSCLSIALFFGQWWAKERGMITTENANILLYVAIVIMVFGLGYMFWPFLKSFTKLMRRLRITIANQKPPSSNHNSEKEHHIQHLLEWYERQKTNWKSYIRLELLDVKCYHVGESSPYVILELVIRNFLPVPLKLIQVSKSEGRIGNRHNLPSLPENYDESVHPCDERRFPIKVDINETVAEYLRTEAQRQCPKPLQWTIKGEWKVEVYGKEQLAWTLADEKTCQSVPIIAARLH